MGLVDKHKAVGFRVDDSDFRRLFARSSSVEPKLRTALRRNIRVAGKDVVIAMQSEVRSGTYATNRGLRDRIAAGMSLSILTGSKPGVMIRSAPTAMQANEKSMVAAWQSQKGWRHRVFNKDVWVTQMGRPFFFSTVAAHRDQVTGVVRAAMVEAAEYLRKA